MNFFVLALLYDARYATFNWWNICDVSNSTAWSLKRDIQEIASSVAPGMAAIVARRRALVPEEVVRSFVDFCLARRAGAEWDSTFFKKYYTFKVLLRLYLYLLPLLCSLSCFIATLKFVSVWGTDNWSLVYGGQRTEDRIFAGTPIFCKYLTEWSDADVTATPFRSTRSIWTDVRWLVRAFQQSRHAPKLLHPTAHPAVRG